MMETAARRSTEELGQRLIELVTGRGPMTADAIAKAIGLTVSRVVDVIYRTSVLMPIGHDQKVARLTAEVERLTKREVVSLLRLEGGIRAEWKRRRDAWLAGCKS